MKISFLFIDDSDNPDTKISSLTGLMIPIELVEEIRNEYYERILDQFIIREKNTINMKIPEIHASKLLINVENVTDELKTMLIR